MTLVSKKRSQSPSPNLLERLRLEDAEIVDEDVGFRHRAQEGLDAFGGGEIGGEALDLGFRQRGQELLLRLAHGGLGAAVDDDMGAACGQALGDGEADAFRRAADHGALSGEIDLHEIVSATMEGTYADEVAMPPSVAKGDESRSDRPPRAVLRWRRAGGAGPSGC